MADRVITAEALITARDGTGDVFEKIAAKFQRIGHGAAISKELEKTLSGLKTAQSHLAALDRLQATRPGFAAAQKAFMTQKAAVEQAARALKNAEKPTKDLEAAYNRAQAAVSKASGAFEKQKAAMIDAKRAAEQFGSPMGKIASEQSRLRASIESTTRAIEKQSAAELKSAEAAAKAARHQDRLRRRGLHDVSGRQVAAGVAGAAVAHSTAHFARHSLEVYRDFDRERRYGKVVMGLTDEEQQPFIDQAVHGGGTSKYNDIQWLEAQRELAARGLKPHQVLALTPVAKDLGQAMDKSLPEASRALEGGMFGFGKDMSTLEKARANAKRTADLQVKAAKISGMNYEDIVQTYKYGAAPWRMAGLSEEQLLAFAGVGKKSNMGGDEMGVAARALSANLLKPTAGARTAMIANGIDYSKFQKLGPRAMQSDPFAQSIAASYGVELSHKAKQSLQRVFDDKALVKDAGKFMPAVMKVLDKELGGSDAKAKKSIAGEARRYRDASMSGVDSQALLNALIPAIRNNPALANAIFGSKQGARIRAALGNDEYEHKLDELKNHSDGFSEKISQERMAGFDGAVSRFEGAIKNLESALPRAFDNDGKGGALTNITDKMGGFVQALAEAPPQLQRLGVEAGAVGAIFAGMKGAEALMGGFGLKGAAVELIRAAHELMASARGQKAGAAAEAAGGLAGAGGATAIEAEKKASKLSRAGKALGRIGRSLPLIGTTIVVSEEGGQLVGDYLKDQKDKPPGAFSRFIAKHVPQLPKPRYRESSDLPGVDDTPHGRRGFASNLIGASTIPSWINQPPHPALAPPGGHAGPIDVTGKITATVDKPVDVTGKVTAEVKGQASVSVTVKVDGPGKVVSQTSSSSGNIKVSTGASMPSAQGGAAAH